MTLHRRGHRTTQRMMPLQASTQHPTTPWKKKASSFDSQYQTDQKQRQQQKWNASNNTDTLTEFATLAAEATQKERHGTVESMKSPLSVVADNIRQLNIKRHEKIETEYDKMAEGIQDGVLCPGVIFYHESTSMDEILPDDQTDVYVTSHETWEDQAKHRHNSFGNSEERDTIEELRESQVVMQEQAEQNYGDKSKELEKFYNILKIADRNNNNSVEETTCDNKTDVVEGTHSRPPRVAQVSFIPDANTSTSSSIPPPPSPAVTPAALAKAAASSEHENEDWEDTDTGGYGQDYSIRPSSARDSKLVESLSQFELQSFRSSTQSMSNPTSVNMSRNYLTSMCDANMLSMRGSSAHLYTVTIWMWNQMESIPKLLDKDSVYAGKHSSVRLNKRLLPGQWVWRTYQQRLDKFRRLQKEIYEDKHYSTLEITVMFFSWVERKLSHGQNHVTEWTNPKILRRFLTVFLFLLLVLDVMLFGVFGVIYFCIYDKTGCDDHTGFVVMLLVWPFALLMAPLSGIKCVILTPLGQVARRYRCWSSYVNITSIAMVSIYWQFFADTPRYYLYFVVSLLLSRFCQHFLIDIYIETQEDKRASRGWDGLFTSVTHSEYDFH